MDALHDFQPRKNTPDANGQPEKKADADKPPLHVVIDSTGLKIYGAGRWLEDKYGAKARREWRKLHLAVDADSGEIIAEVLTDQNSSDVSQLKTLLGNIDPSVSLLPMELMMGSRPPLRKRDDVSGHRTTP